MNSRVSSHVCLPEPKLAFHPERESDRDTHPLRGLIRCGPYSAGIVPDPIRVATICPAGESERLYEFMKQLNSQLALPSGWTTCLNGLGFIAYLGYA